jgi:hypothetical protein
LKMQMETQTGGPSTTTASRFFAGCVETKSGQNKTQALAKAMEAALPAERYARLDMSTQYLISASPYASLRPLSRYCSRPETAAASCEGIASDERNTAPDQRLTCTEERPMRTQDRITWRNGFAGTACKSRWKISNRFSKASRSCVTIWERYELRKQNSGMELSPRKNIKSPAVSWLKLGI